MRFLQGECLRLSDGNNHGLGANDRWLAVLNAFCLIASFAVGFDAFQGNTVAGAVNDSFGVDRVWTGGFLALVAGFIVFGSIHRIAGVADVVVLIMAVAYILMALVVIAINLPSVPGVVMPIVTNAFGLEEAIGGGMGAAIAQGLRRGLFSNEAGLGSATNVGATADVRHPISQGITQMLSVFFFSDPLIEFLAVVNLVVIMMLLPICLRVLRDFREQVKGGVARPVFNPDDLADLDIDRAVWGALEASEEAAAKPAS